MKWNKCESPAGTAPVLTHTLQRMREVGPLPDSHLARAHSSARLCRYSLGLIVAHQTEPLLTVRSAEITVHWRLGLRVGRIYRTFFLLFERAIQVAIPPAHWPRLLPAKMRLSRFLRSRKSTLRDSSVQTPIRSWHRFLHLSIFQTRTFQSGSRRPLDAGNIPSNHHFAVPDVICFRIETIALWPGMVDESRFELRF